jgi:hypothetical protein
MSRQGWGLFVLLVWGLALGSFAGAVTMDRGGRFYEPVEIMGDYVPKMLGNKVKDLTLYSWRENTWHLVLFQIDERTPEGMFILPKGPQAHASQVNGDFDPQDILVFMAREAGERAPETAGPPGASSVVPIRLFDPLATKSAWVYLAWYRDGTPGRETEPIARLADGPGVYKCGFPTYGYDALINDQDKKPIPTIYINKGGYSWLGTMWRS